MQAPLQVSILVEVANDIFGDFLILLIQVEQPDLLQQYLVETLVVGIGGLDKVGTAFFWVLFNW